MINKFILLLFLSLISIQCKKNVESKAISTVSNEIKYANGFSIENYKGFKKLTIHRAFVGDTKESEFYLVSKNGKIPDSLKNKKIIQIPIERIVVTNTSHIPMLEAISEEKSLIGFPNTDYISSTKTREIINSGHIQDLGNEQAMNIEILLNLKPEIVIGFGIDNPSKMYDNIEKMGIPILMNSEWMEETPLGRAEWIKFFGVLYNKDSIAKSEFDKIEKNYINLKNTAKNTQKKPTVLNGSLFQDVWYVSAGESFLAQMISDANADYIWKDSKGTGSLPLSLESVLEKGKNADYWIAPGDFITKNKLVEVNPIYSQFRPLNNGNTFTYAHLKGKNGGFIYFEISPLHPDWVLEDLIHIFHPELKKDNSLHFFKKID